MNTVVMVVEDHDDLRSAIEVILIQAGFQVFSVSCAEDFDDELIMRAPDLFVIDLNLPGECGLSLSARIRRAHPEAGIVITTARTRVGDRVEGYEHGADVYLLKPVAPVELVAALQALGKRSAARRSEPTALRLNEQQLLLSGPRGECRLAEAEVRVLAALAMARNQTLERWQIMLKLSPHDELSADSLQNRLSQLRKKLKFCGVSGESITSVRGVGYRLCVTLAIA